MCYSARGKTISGIHDRRIAASAEPAGQAELARTARRDLLSAIRELGVTDRVAGDMLARYGLPYLWRKVRQTRYARRVGIAARPAGWFVANVRDDWDAPLGFDERDEMSPKELQEALCASWGVCRRCGCRPCHCLQNDHERETGDDGQGGSPRDSQPGE